MKIKIQVKLRTIPYITAYQRCLKQVKRHPNPPVATAIRPAASNRPNEDLLNPAVSMSSGSRSFSDFTLKKLSPIANLIASIEIINPNTIISELRTVSAMAGYLLVLKQTHIFLFYL